MKSGPVLVSSFFFLSTVPRFTLVQVRTGGVRNTLRYGMVIELVHLRTAKLLHCHNTAARRDSLCRKVRGEMFHIKLHCKCPFMCILRLVSAWRRCLCVTLEARRLSSDSSLDSRRRRTIRLCSMATTLF
jgi:hypothetical protein